MIGKTAKTINAILQLIANINPPEIKILTIAKEESTIPQVTKSAILKLSEFTLDIIQPTGVTA